MTKQKLITGTNTKPNPSEETLKTKKCESSEENSHSQTENQSKVWLKELNDAIATKRGSREVTKQSKEIINWNHKPFNATTFKSVNLEILRMLFIIYDNFTPQQ